MEKGRRKGSESVDEVGVRVRMKSGGGKVKKARLGTSVAKTVALG